MPRTIHERRTVHASNGQTIHMRRTVTTGEAMTMKDKLEADLLAAIRDFEEATGIQIADIAIGKLPVFGGRDTSMKTGEVKITAVLP